MQPGQLTCRLRRPRDTKAELFPRRKCETKIHKEYVDRKKAASRRVQQQQRRLDCGDVIIVPLEARVHVLYCQSWPRWPLTTAQH